MSSQERVYVSKACANCQMRHEKCSPHVPCRNCVRHNFDCVFNYTYKKRGRKSKKRVDTNSSIQIQENIFSSSIDNQNQQLCNKMENTTQNHALISYDTSEQSIISNDFNQEQFHPFNDITQKIDFLPQVHENSNISVESVLDTQSN
ncbi:33859_t:CDS:2, partial [Gigaspora margarita]